MTTFNVELSIDDLHELHSLLLIRKCQLNANLCHTDNALVQSSMRQIERLSPLLYYIESMVREHHNRVPV